MMMAVQTLDTYPPRVWVVVDVDVGESELAGP
jgi:hypothetical protein